MVTLKRQNDDLLEHTVQLEDQVVTLKVFSFKTFYFLLFFVIFTGYISKETFSNFGGAIKEMRIESFCQ